MAQKYIPSLDGVRAIAFLIVFLSHAGYQIVPGGFGVTVFFFLSGFLITSLLRKEHAASGTISLYGFYLRRACRILPPLYCALIVTTVLDRFGIPSREVDAQGILSVLLYYFNYAVLCFGRSGVHVANGMGILWSLMVEEHFYLLFPVIYLAMLSRKITTRNQTRLLVLACGLALAWRLTLVFVVHINLASPEIWTYSATDARFDSILWGCVLAICANPWCGDDAGVINRYKVQLALAGAVLLLATFVVRDPRFRETVRYSLQGIALFPVFYFVIATPKSWWPKLLEWPPLRWLGLVSYTMYLVHYFALDIVVKFLPGHRGLSAVLAFIVSGLFCEAIRRFVEIPFRRYAHRKRLAVPA